MPPTLTGFYIQSVEGELSFANLGTDFGAVYVDDDSQQVVAFTDDGEVVIFAGTNDECRAYLAQLPGMLSRAGVPVVFTQGDPRRPSADPDDTVRWGS